MCGSTIVFPAMTCGSGCPMVKSWVQGGRQQKQATAAQETVSSLSQVVRMSWGSDAYREATSHGASSSKFQSIITPTLQKLGYVPESRNKVADAAFKPDFILLSKVDGVMIEVERGKTIDNNMDMLDMWKCHIHPVANHLILLVPIWYVKINSKTGKETRAATFARVCKRMQPFFEPGNETNVHSLHVMGY